MDGTNLVIFYKTIDEKNVPQDIQVINTHWTPKEDLLEITKEKDCDGYFVTMILGKGEVK